MTKKGMGREAEPVPIPQSSDSRGTFTMTWGAGYHGQLGRKFVRGEKKYAAIPQLVREPTLVVRQVACGGLHTALVTESGRVYTWGDGRAGQLGHSHDPSVKQTPRQVEKFNDVFVVMVACGRSHTVALSDRKEVWSWGEARYGQLGLSDRQTRRAPERVQQEACKQIKFIACGDKHTVAVRDDGACLSWGCGEHGQTGHGEVGSASQVRLSRSFVLFLCCSL
jgi:alpha-tubulin suppressor-like RCC1 family protein